MDKLYNIPFEHDTDIKNTGLDYSEIVLKKTASNYIFRSETLNNFLHYVNKILVLYINSVKRLRVFYNIAVDENYKNIN